MKPVSIFRYVNLEEKEGFTTCVVKPLSYKDSFLVLPLPSPHFREYPCSVVQNCGSNSNIQYKFSWSLLSKSNTSLARNGFNVVYVGLVSSTLVQFGTGIRDNYKS